MLRQLYYAEFTSVQAIFSSIFVSIFTVFQELECNFVLVLVMKMHQRPVPLCWCSKEDIQAEERTLTGENRESVKPKIPYSIITPADLGSRDMYRLNITAYFVCICLYTQADTDIQYTCVSIGTLP